MKPALQRILYVEDDVVLQLLLRRSLERLGGFTVAVCGAAREAVAVARSFKPQLILLDVMMPDMDGPAVLQSLRADSDLAAVPVAFVTARSSGADVEALLAMGAIGVIAKPFDPTTLADRVNALWAGA